RTPSSRSGARRRSAAAPIPPPFGWLAHSRRLLSQGVRVGELAAGQVRPRRYRRPQLGRSRPRLVEAAHAPKALDVLAGAPPELQVGARAALEAVGELLHGVGRALARAFQLAEAVDLQRRRVLLAEPVALVVDLDRHDDGRRVARVGPWAVHGIAPLRRSSVSTHFSSSRNASGRGVSSQNESHRLQPIPVLSRSRTRSLART